MARRDNPAKAARRRGFGIRAYIGANGGGKSLAAVHDALVAMDSGRYVLSNVRLWNPETGQPHKLWIPLTSFQQLMQAKNCDVLLDEVTGVASARESAALPAQVANMLVQLRRRDLTLSWTTPSWSRADKILREVTTLVTVCRGHMPEKTVDAAMNREWRQKRLFRWTSFDATSFDEWTTALSDRTRKRHADRVTAQWFWRPDSRAARAYRTYEDVAILGHSLSVGGACLSCGGRRTVPRCSCSDQAPARRQPAVPVRTMNARPA